MSVGDSGANICLGFGITNGKLPVPVSDLTCPDYKRFMNALTAKGQYVPLSRKFAKALGLLPAALALHIANSANRSADENGFLMATNSYLREGLGLSDDEIYKALDALTRWNITRVDYREGKRYVRVDLDRLIDVVSNRS
jgi:hypothetical protein